jgi:hypothetical protein
MIENLIGQGVSIAVVIYFGLHLRQKLQTLQTTAATQKETIEALVKHREDFEALNRIMKQTLDAMQMITQELRTELAQTKNVLLDQARRERIATWRTAVDRDDFEYRQFADSDAYATLRGYLPEDLQQEIDTWQNPMMVVARPRGGRDPRQARLLQEVARLEGQWGLI